MDVVNVKSGVSVEPWRYAYDLHPTIRDRMLRENHLDVLLFEAATGRCLEHRHGCTVTGQSVPKKPGGR